MFAFDFSGTIWAPDRAILAGHSPYPAPDAHALARAGNPSVYPPPMLLASLPLGLLSVGHAALIFSSVSLAALVAALAVAGVRDWRCYVLLVATPAVCSMVVLGQMEGLLALGCVVAWRKRDHAIISGLAVAAVIAAKLFLAPIIVWLVVTRRYKAAVIAAAGAGLTLLVSWAVIGFDGLREYPALLAADSRAFEAGSQSFVAFGMHAGLPESGARVAAIGAGLGLLWLSLLLAPRTQGDRRSFTAAMAAGVVLSPIAWLHYFVLIFVGTALTRPRADIVWAAMYLTWVSTGESAGLSRMIGATSIVALIFACNLRITSRERERAEPPIRPRVPAQLQGAG